MKKEDWNGNSHKSQTSPGTAAQTSQMIHGPNSTTVDAMDIFTLVLRRPLKARKSKHSRRCFNGNMSLCTSRTLSSIMMLHNLIGKLGPSATIRWPSEINQDGCKLPTRNASVSQPQNTFLIFAPMKEVCALATATFTSLQPNWTAKSLTLRRPSLFKTNGQSISQTRPRILSAPLRPSKTRTLFLEIKSSVSVMQRNPALPQKTSRPSRSTGDKSRSRLSWRSKDARRKSSSKRKKNVKRKRKKGGSKRRNAERRRRKRGKSNRMLRMLPRMT